MSTFTRMSVLILLCANSLFAQDRKSIHQLQHEQHEDTSYQQELVNVQPGIEVLFREHVYDLYGKSVGLVVNHTAVDKEWVHLVDRLVEHEQITIRAIFAPEHGYRGEAAAGQEIKDGIDPVSGAKVYSLYGMNRMPSGEMLEGIDVLIYDIQDVGVRFYTYISTMGYAMQAAAGQGIEFWVLDRPNPITGYILDGPMLRRDYRSFVGLYPIPIRYGLTPGELALMLNGEEWLDFPDDFNPKIIAMEGWGRDLWYDETDLPWVAPSPNMPDLETATVYPGLCFIEGTNVSEGRGTDYPFRWIGAPWIQGIMLADSLNRKDLPGVLFKPVEFRPEEIPGKAVNPKYENQLCQGVEVLVTDRDNFQAVRTGVYILHSLFTMYPEKFEWRENHIDRLYGSEQLRKFFRTGQSLKALFREWEREQMTYAGLMYFYLLPY